MFSSDVSSRGMDYPGITLVLQLGAPTSRSQYIHRIGRTGRAENKGRAHMLLLESEQHFMDSLHDIPVKRAHFDGKVGEVLLNAMSSWSSSTQLNQQAASGFASLLTHYKLYHRGLRLTDDEVVHSCVRMMVGTGMAGIPLISRRLALHLDLDKHPLLRISKDLDDDSFDRDFSVDLTKAPSDEKELQQRDGSSLRTYG